MSEQPVHGSNIKDKGAACFRSSILLHMGLVGLIDLVAHAPVAHASWVPTRMGHEAVCVV